MIEVPWQQVDPETLVALLEEFVTRDGTDYGDEEVPVARRVEQVRRQLQRGEVVIVFDELSESVNVLTRDDFRARLRQAGGE